MTLDGAINFLFSRIITGKKQVNVTLGNDNCNPIYNYFSGVLITQLIVNNGSSIDIVEENIPPNKTNPVFV
jgi:hypothetical protein